MVAPMFSDSMHSIQKETAAAWSRKELQIRFFRMYCLFICSVANVLTTYPRSTERLYLSREQHGSQHAHMYGRMHLIHTHCSILVGGDLNAVMGMESRSLPSSPQCCPSIAPTLSRHRPWSREGLQIEHYRIEPLSISEVAHVRTPDPVSFMRPYVFRATAQL